ncbi:MAG: ATP-binding protein [Anaerolineae bacterium]|nr:ATP-binding protein [Anaerolineae bacterium]
MTIDWTRLRTIEGSQQTAFEKLCCQLANDERPTTGSEFVVKGQGGDAGIECYWKLPDNQEYGWQAKFFVSPPNPSQWSQVDDSVKTALAAHPNLTQYTICLPIDRSDARAPNQTSFYDRWNKHVRKWEQWALKQTGKSVRFIYWGHHEIFSRLSNGTRGRFLWWFNQEFLDDAWFVEQLKRSISIAGPRYTPELNIELPIARVFSGLGRTTDYLDRFYELHKQLRKEHKYDLMEFRDKAPELQQKLNERFGRIYRLLEKTYNTLPTEAMPFQEIKSEIDEALTVLSDLFNKLPSEIELEADEPDRAQRRRQSEYYLGQMRKALHRLQMEVMSNPAKVSNRPFLTVIGGAGNGKTHLFCDVASQRIAAGMPTLLIMGEVIRSGEPWSEIVKWLHLQCSVDEFLAAMNTKAQIQGNRGLILIDALNESGDYREWLTYLPDMLAKLEAYDLLGLVVSIRSPYDEYIINEDMRKSGKLTIVEHKGFVGYEYRAVQTFFDYYQIEQPNIPLLNPEFGNPLFLKVFCKSLNNQGARRLPRGSQGLSQIYYSFFDSVNNKLAQQENLNYRASDNKVRKALDLLAKEMIDCRSHYLPSETAQNIANSVWGTAAGYTYSFYYHLLAEGVLTEVAYDRDGELIENCRLAYERFSDYVIGKQLLDQYLDHVNPHLSFGKSQPLYMIVTGEQGLVLQRSAINAFSILLPEMVGLELVELVPDVEDEWFLRDAFIDSIVWRQWNEASVIPEGARSYVNNKIGMTRAFLGVIISVAANPENPFNARQTHRILMNQTMASRDSWWSTFLHENYYASDEYSGSINRLLDWALSLPSNADVFPESLHLCGLMLGWFLTASNRFLRDTTTKALVNLYVPRIEALIAIIDDFMRVDDPYILERLFAVAYGCAMRSRNETAVNLLAQKTFDWVFSNAPPVHILLRDYARGVIEVAVARGIILEDTDIDKVRPPYHSDWIEDPPTEAELRQRYGQYTKDMPDVNWSQVHLYNSVMGFGDFARYILGTNSGHWEWSAQRLSEPRHLPPKEAAKQFFENLSIDQRKKWTKVQKCSSDISDRIRKVLQNWESEKEDKFDELDEAERESVLSSILEASDIRQEVEKLEKENQDFLKFLDTIQAKQFTEVVEPYLRNEYEATKLFRDSASFDISLAQRWIIQRVFELGWTTDRFGRFDRYINSSDRRQARKSERIGKKYQWIAYHEFLARVADNFHFQADSWINGNDPKYDGAWQLNIRDIDPSILTKDSKKDKWISSTNCWWFTEKYNDWDRYDTRSEWLRSTGNLPNIQNLIQVTQSTTNTVWLNLDAYYTWQESAPPFEDEYERETCSLWYMLRSYVVAKDHIDELYEWAKEQDFMGRWMPEAQSLYHAFLGEFYWSPAYKYHRSPVTQHYDWTTGEESTEVPFPVGVTVDYYVSEREYDCSITDTIRIVTPSQWLATSMKLKWNSREGEYVNQDGTLAAIDPSVDVFGPSSLLFNKHLLLQFLDENGYDLIWTLLGEKQIFGGEDYGQANGYTKINGVFRLSNGEVVGNPLGAFVGPSQYNS